jgi:hypothetical protein
MSGPHKVPIEVWVRDETGVCTSGATFTLRPDDSGPAVPVALASSLHHLGEVRTAEPVIVSAGNDILFGRLS